MKRKHIKHLLLFINNTVMTQDNGRIYNIHVRAVAWPKYAGGGSAS